MSGEVVRVLEARRMQQIQHPFQSRPTDPWCAVCSLHRQASVHSDVDIAAKAAIESGSSAAVRVEEQQL